MQPRESGARFITALARGELLNAVVSDQAKLDRMPTGKFLLAQSTDHITPLTGATPTHTISNAGASLARPSGTVTEIGSGWYKVAANATDSGTLGLLLLHATATSGDPSDRAL